ncbi:Multivesicular body subunit 12A ESCRT-I complex subunit MVB12A [Takifugu flavidus]|uniref:Multivesicular body subunit 12A n=1 Tax=Takifugu flavidus TaxID=433684 RepID=A0A5C6MWQ7_9TELE|nr:Multivesicular body subunit 12A ESCRT-I complex subunit MVB12A [Takifugu flavidus]
MMSLMERGSGVRPVTAVAWTSNSSTCPKDFIMINVTEDGAAANFTRSFGMKSGYYLCFSKDLACGMVVADIQLISDKESIPHGYCYIAEHLEPKATVSKKKRLCARLLPVGSVDTAVLDIKLTAKSKMMLHHHTYVGDIHGYVLWCRKGYFSSPFPQAKPRSVSLDFGRLSLDQPSAPQPLRPSNPPPPPLPANKLSQRRHTLKNKDNGDKPADGSIPGINALDGVPFSLHPKFDMRVNVTALNNPLKDIHIKSLQDIENEYNYTFVVEESAAKRLKPTVSAGGAPATQ